MNCTTCSGYNRGFGKKACLQCPKYRDVQLKSGKRRSIKIELLPDEILNNYPDVRERNVQGAIKLLPLRLAIPLLARFLAGATVAEIAQDQGISAATVARRIHGAMEIVRRNVQ